MTRYVDRDKIIPPGSVVVPEWLLADLIKTMRRSMVAHEVVARTLPTTLSESPAARGARMGESTICAAYLRVAIEEIKPTEISESPTAWGARMGESTICAAYLRCALDQLQALKDEQ